jgi:Tol biopolymer transport system component
MKNLRTVYLIIVLLSSLLGGCGGYPRLLSFPFDRGGRSLNSNASQLNPQIVSPYIVFVSDRNGSQDVYLYNTQTRRLVDLPGLNSLNEVASHPSISQDGRYLVFGVSRQGNTGIYLYDRETAQKRELTANIQAEVRNPLISANGERIVFEVAQDGQWDIFVSDRQGNVMISLSALTEKASLSSK